jgi:hypothetical protein
MSRTALGYWVLCSWDCQKKLALNFIRAHEEAAALLNKPLVIGPCTCLCVHLQARLPVW